MSVVQLVWWLSRMERDKEELIARAEVGIL
jgi:hypothetical protein